MEVQVHCKYDALEEPKGLRDHPFNRNNHPEDQIERLSRLFSYHGIRHPIIVSKRTGYIVAGHGRKLAAVKADIKFVPVVYQDFKDDDAEYAFIQADNAIALWADLDLSAINGDLPDLDGSEFDLDMLGIKDFTLDMADKELEGDEDEIPDKVEPKAKPGDLYQLAEHRLMCGDSTNLEHVELLMGGQKADLWIADPPFGVSYTDKNAATHGGVPKNQQGKEIKGDNMSVEDLKSLWRDAAANAYVVSTDQASNYWCACQGSDKMMMMMMMMLDEAGWNIRHELIWVKQQFVFGRSDYHYRHEPIIYGWKKTGTHNWYGDRKQDSVFEIDRPRKSDLHPTTKPVELFQKFIENSSKQGDRVFESFGGSGTTLIACEKTHRISYTMELDPMYVDVIIARWEKLTGLKAELIND